MPLVEARATDKKKLRTLTQRTAPKKDERNRNEKGILFLYFKIQIQNKMKVKIKVEKEVDLKLLIVKAGVRYWENTEINGENDTEDGDNIPCKDGSLWSPHIEIETGKILNWKQGVKAEIHYKVVDCLGYEIQDENGQIVLSAEDGYVPSTLCPKGNGYGDYIIMDIDENGQIDNWNFDFSDFDGSED